MHEILPGVHHWSTFHDGIGKPVHSYLLAHGPGGTLIDPRVPDDGIGSLREHGPPREILLTNRHHYRHSGRIAAELGCRVHCHRAGLHEFTRDQRVQAFEFGDEPAPGVRAIEIGALCAEETAFFVERHGGIVALGDAVVVWDRDLTFVPDPLLGDDPSAVRTGLRDALRRLVDGCAFQHVLLAHGAPMIGDGRERLLRFLH